MKLLLTLAIMVATTTLVQAHAFLDHAEPKVGSMIEASPARVTIWFTEDVKEAESSISVFDLRGDEVDRKDSRIAAGSRTQMAVTLPRLPPGNYKVVWKAVCKLGHHTSGSFTFRIVE